MYAHYQLKLNLRSRRAVSYLLLRMRFLLTCFPLQRQAGQAPRVAVLLSRGAPVNSRLGACTALHAAVRLGREDIVRLLVEALAAVDARAGSKEGLSALHLAAAASSVPMARLLLELGADPTVFSSSGQTPDQLAPLKSKVRPILLDAHQRVVGMSEESLGDGVSRQLVEASHSGDVVKVQALLRARADPDAKSHLSTALCSAVAGLHLDLVLLLLRSGASANLPTADGLAPLHIAARCGPTATVALLIQATADPTETDRDGKLACERPVRSTLERRKVQRALCRQLLARVSWTGWLVKLGGKRRSWRRRFCVLLQDQFCYFVDDSLAVSKGSVPLTTRVYEQLRSPSFYPRTPTRFSFELGCGERSYVFCASSQAQLDLCMEQLSSVLSHCRWQRLSAAQVLPAL